VELRQVYPWNWTDVMSYCANEWPSDFTYKGIRDRLIAEGGGTTQAASAWPEATEYLAVFGRANLTQGTAELGTLYRLRDIPAPEPPTPSADWTLELLNPAGSALASYPFTPKPDTEPQPGEDLMASIIETVPWADGTARVVVRYQGTIVAERPVSANGPTVQITYPNGGENLSGPSVNVTWTANDPDGDPLVYALLYSADAGATWQTLVTGLTQTGHTVDLSELPGSDQALFKVIASDGVNTGQDQSDVTFRVARKAPAAFIIAPDEGARFLPEQQVMLAGEGYDPEDGNLPDAGLSWSSDRQGNLGNGRQLSVSGLQVGRHVITLQARDSDGQIKTASRAIYVGMPTYLPLVLRQ